MIRVCASCGAENRVPLQKLDRKATCGRCKQQLAPQDEPLSVATAEEFQELVSQSALPVLVDLWAPWCGPCRAVAPEIDQLARRKAGRVLVAKINTDAVPAVAQRLGVRSIPTLILFERGHEQKRVAGALRAPQIEQTFAL